MFRRSHSFIFIFFIIFGMMLFSSCTNPFAPGLSNTPLGENVFADQKTVDGVFQNFRSAYLYKDTLAYGRLLDKDFIFIYRNYETGVDGTWGRDQDMFTTSGLFNAAQNLDLIWNDIVVSTGDSIRLDIARGFNLTITFNPQDILRVQGRVNLQLKRNSTEEVWKIVRWRDESNY